MIKGKIRPVKIKDLLGCQDVIYHALEVGCEDDKCIIKNRKSYSLTNIKKYFRNSKVFVFEHNKKIIATGRLTKNNEIRMIYVEPEFHDKGVGTKMINFLEELAQGKKIKKVHLHSFDSAIGFYLKRGFHKVKGFVKRDNQMDKELGVRIRKANKKDLQKTLEIDNQKSIKVKDIERAIKNKDVIFLLAEEGNKIIGYIFGCLDQCKKEDALIYETRVDKKYRGKKIGTKLVDEFCKKCFKKKAKTIIVLVDKKHLKFYSGSCKFKKLNKWIEVVRKLK